MAQQTCGICGGLFSCTCIMIFEIRLFKRLPRVAIEKRGAKIPTNDKRKSFRKIGNTKQTRWN
jgi:hypothetical protein